MFDGNDNMRIIDQGYALSRQVQGRRLVARIFLELEQKQNGAATRG
jgi:hypothetical protein